MNEARAFYGEVRDLIEQILVKAYGADFDFATLHIGTNGRFELKTFSEPKPDGSYFVDTIHADGLFTPVISDERSEFGHEEVDR